MPHDLSRRPPKSSTRLGLPQPNFAAALVAYPAGWPGSQGSLAVGAGPVGLVPGAGASSGTSDAVGGAVGSVLGWAAARAEFGAGAPAAGLAPRPLPWAGALPVMRSGPPSIRATPAGDAVGTSVACADAKAEG